MLCLFLCTCWFFYFFFCFHLLRRQNIPHKDTTHIDFPGIPTHILLNTTGLSPPARPDRLELLSISGTVIKTLPIRYYPDRQPYNLWNITEFVPPNEAFFLRVTGYDRDGFLFQRVSSVSFSNIVPGQWCILLPYLNGYIKVSLPICLIIFLNQWLHLLLYLPVRCS